MATYASRPAWGLRARAISSARIAVPAGLFGLAAISLYIRTREAGIGFWIDEGLSYGIADRPLANIPHALREDGSPPLYYMLLHFWLGLGFHSEAFVRGLSILCSLIAIPAAFWAGRMVWRTAKAGWIAAVLMALNPYLSQFAQEARMYALVALLIIPATTCFLRAYAMEAEGSRRPWIAGFAVSIAAALYTHNWPIFFTVAAAAAWLFLYGDAERERRRELIRDGLLGFGGALVLYLPWIPTTLYQAAHTGAPWSDKPALSSLLGVPGVLLGRLPEIVLLLCAGAGLLVLIRPRHSERARIVVSLVILAVITPLLAWLMSQVSPAWADRYLAVGLAPLLLLAAGGLAWGRRLGMVGLVLVVVMWAQDKAPVEKSNVRAVSEAIAPSLGPGDLVVTTQPETVAVLGYYLPKGLQYASLTGALTDHGVWDWRDGVTRLQATTPQKDLEPLIAHLQPGHRLVLVQPITWALARWQAPWTKLVRLRSKEWDQYLSNDPRLEVTSEQPVHFSPPRPNPVEATVYVKTR